MTDCRCVLDHSHAEKWSCCYSDAFQMVLHGGSNSECNFLLTSSVHTADDLKSFEDTAKF